MSKPVILLDAGQLVGLSGTVDGDVLTWNGTAWVSSPGGGVGTVTSITAGTGLLGGTITTSGTISMPNVGTAASYGSASSVPVFTTDAQGRVSAVTDASIGISTAQVTGLDTALAGKALKTTTVSAGTGLSGGGDLSANRTISMPNVGTASSYGSASSVPVITTDAQGRVFSVTPTAIAIAQSQVADLVNDLAGKVPTTTEVIAGTGLSGGGSLSGNVTLSLPSVGAQGEYGSASSVAVVTTDAQGRVSSATTTAIAITQSQVADLVTDLGNKADKSVTATAGTGLAGGGTLASNFSFSLDTVGTEQTDQGSSSKTVTLSTDAYGRVIALSEQSIGSLPASAISSGQLALAQGGTGIDASSVSAGQLLVGGTGALALQSISQDGSLASDGKLTVTGLQTNPVSATALGAPDAGKALVWSGSEWQASTIQGGGGGGGLTFYMNYAASSPFPMSTVFDENAGWDTGAITVADDANGTALGTFVTAVGAPAIEIIPAGLWDVNFYAQASNNANTTAVRIKVATLAGTTQTVIATSDWVYISDPSAVVGYSASVYVPLTDVSLTDRVEIIFEGRRYGAAARTITLHFGTDSITHAHTTISAPGGTGLLKVVDGYLQSPASPLVNADVDAAAAIAVSKLAAGTNTYVLTTVAGVPTWSPSAAGGVSSILGVADQVLVSNPTGTVTLSLPQSIGTSSSPTFAGLTLGSFSGLLRATGGILAGGASVSLTSEVSGTLPIENGGTNLTASGASGNLLVSDGSAWASVPMTSDASIASTGAMTLKNTGSAGTYGSASAVPVFVTDPQGRVTGVTNTPIAVSGSNFGSQAANTVLAAPNGASGDPSFRALVASDIPSLSSVYLPLSGGTLTGKLITPASTTATAGLNLPPGTAPTSPVSGDMWTTTANLFVRINTTTYTLGLLNNAQTWTASNTFSNSVNSFGTSTLGGTTGLATGATASGATKNVNIGTGGVSGSTTVITIGAALGASTTTVNGTLAAATAAVDTSSTQVATTAYVVGQEYLKSATASSIYAPLASPTFTGTVTIPTISLTGASITATGNTLNIASSGFDTLYLQTPNTTTAQNLWIQSGYNSTGITGSYVVVQGGSNATAGGSVNIEGGRSTLDTNNGAVFIGTTYTKRIQIGGSLTTSFQLVGSPTTTTQATSDDSTKIATTAFVKAQGYAPIASPTFTGTVTIPAGASISGYAPLASPTFTGTVAIPTLTLTNALGATSGGTGQSTYATGDLLYASATNTLSKRAAGTNGQVLTMSGGVPTWSSASSGGVTSITGTADQVIASASTGAITLSLPQSISTSSSPSFATLTATTAVVTDVLKTRTGSSIYIGDGTSSDPVIMEAGYRFGYGRSIVIRGGVPTGTSLPGGDATVKGGDALSGGTGNGGHTFITGGSKNSGTGLDGIVYIGLSDTDSVVIGASNITTTINGTLSLLNKLAVSNLAAGTNGYVLTTVAGVPTWAAASSGSGTVTSVTLDAGSTGLTISAGAAQTITTSGTFLLGGTLGAGYGGTGVSTTAQSYVFAGPASGSGTPSFRQLAAADITGISGTYAPLASPTFTGTPLSTTAAVDNDTTQIATTAYVVGQGYLKSATASSTYAPLASPTFSGTVTIPAGASIAGYLTTATAASTYAPIASPTFTGTVTISSLSGLLRATAGAVAGSATVALGSEVSGTLPIANGGTNNASLSVTQGTVYYGDGTKLVGLAPGTSGQVLQTRGSSTNPIWASTPYDLSDGFVGTPVASAVIMRFVAARAFTFGGTAYFACVTGPTSAATFTVNVNGVSKGTVTVGTGSTGDTGFITSTSIVAGDLITVVATTPAAIVSPYWTLPGTV